MLRLYNVQCHALAVYIQGFTVQRKEYVYTMTGKSNWSQLSTAQVQRKMYGYSTGNTWPWMFKFETNLRRKNSDTLEDSGR